MTTTCRQLAEQFAKETNYPLIAYSGENKGWHLYYLYSPDTNQPMRRIEFREDCPRRVQFMPGVEVGWAQAVNVMRGS